MICLRIWSAGRSADGLATDGGEDFQIGGIEKDDSFGLRGDVYLGAGAVGYADGGVGCELVLASCQQEVACQGYDYDKYE